MKPTRFLDIPMSDCTRKSNVRVSYHRKKSWQTHRFRERPTIALKFDYRFSTHDKRCEARDRPVAGFDLCRRVLGSFDNILRG